MPRHLAVSPSMHGRVSLLQLARRRGVISFLALVFAASIVVAVAVPRSAVAPLISAFIPVGVLVLLTPFGGRLVWTGLGLSRAGLRLWPAAVAVPVMVSAIGYAVSSGLGLVEPPTVAGVDVVSMLVSVCVATVLVLGEELAWRGYLQPRIQQLTTRPAGAILTAVAHAAVHLPLIVLTSTYNSVGSRWVIAPLTMVTVTGAGVFYGWLRDVTRSIWPAALAHAAGNTLLAFTSATALPTAAVSMAYVAGEGGVVTAVAMTAAAVAVLRHGRCRVWRAEPTAPPASRSCAVPAHSSYRSQRPLSAPTTHRK